jgi:hypothetical protein
MRIVSRHRDEYRVSQSAVRIRIAVPLSGIVRLLTNYPILRRRMRILQTVIDDDVMRVCAVGWIKWTLLIPPADAFAGLQCRFRFVHSFCLCLCLGYESIFNGGIG